MILLSWSFLSLNFKKKCMTCLPSGFKWDQYKKILVMAQKENNRFRKKKLYRIGDWVVNVTSRAAFTVKNIWPNFPIMSKKLFWLTIQFNSLINDFSFYDRLYFFSSLHVMSNNKKLWSSTWHASDKYTKNLRATVFCNCYYYFQLLKSQKLCDNTMCCLKACILIEKKTKIIFPLFRYSIVTTIIDWNR